MRIVIGAAARDIHGDDAHLLQLLKQLDGLRKIDLHRVGRIQTKAIQVGLLSIPFHWLPHILSRPIRQRVEDTQANHHSQVGELLTDALNNRPQNASSAGQVPSVPTLARAGTEQFVQQVSMTSLDVDELETDFLGNARCDEVVVDQPIQFIVRPENGVIVWIDAEFRIEQRMTIGDSRCSAGGIGTAEAAGVGQLQAHDEIIRGPTGFLMGGAQLFEQRGQSRSVIGCRERLIRIRSSVRLDRRRLAAPDQFRAAEAKVPPATERMFGG